MNSQDEEEIDADFEAQWAEGQKRIAERKAAAEARRPTGAKLARLMDKFEGDLLYWAHVFEYDDRLRHRIEFLLNEVSRQNRKLNPPPKDMEKIRAQTRERVRQHRARAKEARLNPPPPVEPEPAREPGSVRFPETVAAIARREARRKGAIMT
jgi:hypothetical protein